MPKKAFLSIFLMALVAVLLFFLGKEVRQKKTSVVAPATETAKPAAVQPAVAETEPSPPSGSVINPNIEMEIYAYTGKWEWRMVETEPFTVPMREWRYGHGESYLLKASQGGKVEEVYENYCTDYDNTSSKCRKEETVVVRTRWVKPGQIFRVVSGAVVRLEGREICRPAERPWWQTPLEEIRDPEWKPRGIERHFDSVADLRQFARERGTWIVIGSEKGAPLLGYHYREAPVYTVTNDGKALYAFALLGHPKEKPAKPLEGCAAWPIHVEYRYLPIGVGHDTEYGVGCVSIFGFAGGSDVRDLHNVQMCILSRGEAYWYGDHVPQYNLDVIQ